jgi:hypothetical protein
MRALKLTRAAVVVGTMAASLLMAGGAQAASAGDKDDRYEKRDSRSGSYTEYAEREEFYSERSGRHHREKKMRDYWEERDRDHKDMARWHFADPKRGDFDFRHGDEDRGRHHHSRGARAGDGGDGGR